MAELSWDVTGSRRYESGICLGVLYRPDSSGAYSQAYAWDGLVSVTESASGAETSPLYADNKKYQNLPSTEEFSGTIEAYTYPEAFEVVDGAIKPQPGVGIHQQARKMFGLSYVSLVGNDVLGLDFGYKLHLVWGAIASPSEKAFGTLSDSPDPMTFSWEFSTSPVKIGIGTLKPTASIVIDSTKVPKANLERLQDILYGTTTTTTNPRLPDPAFVINLMMATGFDILDGGTSGNPGTLIVDGGTSSSSTPDVIDGGTSATLNLNTFV